MLYFKIDSTNRFRTCITRGTENGIRAIDVGEIHAVSSCSWRSSGFYCGAVYWRAVHTNDAQHISSCWSRRGERHTRDPSVEGDNHDSFQKLEGAIGARVMLLMGGRIMYKG